MTATLQPLRVSNDALDDADELRARMGAEGYLFIERLFDPDAVLALRREMLHVMQAGGWLAAGTDPMDGVADVSRRCSENDIGYTDVYHEVYKLQAFHEAGHWPEVLGLMQQLIDGPVFPHPIKIARLWFPQYTDHTTPAHQDYVHNQGAYETFTCWAPVGECPLELGGLAVLPCSPKTTDVIDHHFSLGAGGLSLEESLDRPEWRSTNYEPGDALVFHSLTPHKALPNVTENRLRVSLDNRYQSTHAPIAEGLLRPHLNKMGSDGEDLGPMSWDEVYAGWTDDRLQYYWRDREGPTVPKDQRYADAALEEAFELARQGDPAARLRLERLRRREPNSARGLEAAAVLDGAS